MTDAPNPGGRPRYPRPRTPINLRLDDDVLAAIDITPILAQDPVDRTAKINLLLAWSLRELAPWLVLEDRPSFTVCHPRNKEEEAGHEPDPEPGAPG